MTYTVHCLPGMLALGQLRKVFTSAEAFEGYLEAVRAAGGYLISWTTVYECTVSRWVQA